MLAILAAFAQAEPATVAPVTHISAEHPLIVLQTADAYGDRDGAPPDTNKMEEAAKHGREVVRLWGLVPEDIREYCQLQIECRVSDHGERLNLFRRMLREMQAADVPVSIQVADPHDQFVFEPAAVSTLLDEFPCIRSLMLSELHFATYAKFNVERYAIPAHVRYAADIIELGARTGRHVLIVLQGLKWLHIGADVLNRPLLEAMRTYPDYVIPVNEHIEPRHLVRQTAAWGLWLGGYAAHWGVEPQSWWYESSFMNGPGVFGDHLHPLHMPPALYRAMILQGAALGADVYSFEPFWDLFDFENNRCWNDYILPTLRDLIARKMIPSREQVLKKTKVAYRLAPARDVNEFHVNLRDLDWISDEGLLARAAYGVWAPMLEFELIPNKSNWFIPLFPPETSQPVFDQFSYVIDPGRCDTVEDYEALLKPYYPCNSKPGQAWTCSINGFAYVMQTHENLYERQAYVLDLPKPVRSLNAQVTPEGLRLEWPADPGARLYRVLIADNPLDTTTRSRLRLLGETVAPVFTRTVPQGGAVYTVTAVTDTREKYEGTVNFLDYLVFSETESEPAEYACVEDGNVRVVPVPETPDTRPASQVVHPLFEGVPDGRRAVAEEIVQRLDTFKDAYEAMNWRAATDFYAAAYEDSNGFHRDYVSRCWKWWFRRNNKTLLLRQIRNWDFSDYDATGQVRMRLFLLCTAVRRDDQPFGYDGLVRFPRHKGAEVTCTWVHEDGTWKILRTDPAMPNLEEILWNDRPMDKDETLVPGVDE